MFLFLLPYTFSSSSFTWQLISGNLPLKTHLNPQWFNNLRSLFNGNFLALPPEILVQWFSVTAQVVSFLTVVPDNW